MSDPYGPTFPPPNFMAPREPEPGPGALDRVRKTVAVTAPVAALVLIVGVLAVVIYRGEHPGDAVSDGDRRANVPTSAAVAPARPAVHAS
ncbi:hypothetical protein [Nocardia seriolae]|uniref:Uncharacterized protein n=1 Tax=Nocardia seriolae TaxID=37332 RepID=A0A0B8N9Q0_9NOCA|nr:hypothetical protein [Nocardia seriolae]MTJ63328.1 hypothetical protein [Nocardia seriolae]MTJ71205.1 hypothetical protein [Nocardia seriolae]MTJ88870.1 hypothetical protein [Nocardia seriolae]MTK32852.1 hypothetical protein [Nocardia seriolae]MTK41224.1 hypothetical protein [Nocardia seriolae]